MINLFKRLAGRSRLLLICYYIYENWRVFVNLKRGRRIDTVGSRHAGMTINESLKYIDKVVNDYFSFSGLPRNYIINKRILEIGPGDNLGVALTLLSEGASQVVCMDKFLTSRDPYQEIEIYRAMRDRFDNNSKMFFNQAIHLKGEIECNPFRLRYIQGRGIDEPIDSLQLEPFDIILSRAVLEEIHRIDDAFLAMDRLLLPGGVMIHFIDLSDYRMFIDFGMHPLTFLTIPGFIYTIMSGSSCRPNRKRLNYYRDIMLKMGYEVELIPLAVIGSLKMPRSKAPENGLNLEEIEAARSLVKMIRPKLAAEFRMLSDDDLIPSGICLVAKKTDGFKRYRPDGLIG
jgi:SAM-dependent methyltransferase